MDYAQLRHLYHATLTEDVIPFWERHAIDADGAVNTCLADEGRVLSRNRWCWSQWRALWVFSKLYNTVAPEPRWLSIAQGIYRYLKAHGPDQNGHWPMLLGPDGHVKRGYESIFTDGFAIYALVELWRATGNDQLLSLALRTFRAVEEALDKPDLPPIFPYPSPPGPGAVAHGLSMTFSLAHHELAKATSAPAVRTAALAHHHRVMNVFFSNRRNLVREWLTREGEEFPPPAGTAILPGHAIESMWFQMHIAHDLGEQNVLDRAVGCIRRNLEIGWDCVFGGLLYAVDADGNEKVAWPFADAKLWWVHAEALYATLLAYEHCRQPWCLEWHEKIRQYSFSHFPVKAHGEWRQKLDRHGCPMAEVVALPVKDPFHLPRALILCTEVLDRLLAPAPTTRSPKLLSAHH